MGEPALQLQPENEQPNTDAETPGNIITLESLRQDHVETMIVLSDLKEKIITLTDRLDKFLTPEQIDEKITAGEKRTLDEVERRISAKMLQRDKSTATSIGNLETRINTQLQSLDARLNTLNQATQTGNENTRRVIDILEAQTKSNTHRLDNHEEDIQQALTSEGDTNVRMERLTQIVNETRSIAVSNQAANQEAVKYFRAQNEARERKQRNMQRIKALAKGTNQMGQLGRLVALGLTALGIIDAAQIGDLSWFIELIEGIFGG